MSWEKRAVDEMVKEELITKERELCDKLSYLETRMSEASSHFEADSLGDLWFETEEKLIEVQRVLDAKP